MNRISTTRLIVATVISLLIVGLFGFRVAEAERASARTIGIYVDQSVDPPFEVLELLEEGPAERSGLQVGDRIVGARGVPFEHVTDFDSLTKEFEPGVPVPFDIIRDGEEKVVHLVPGIDQDWWYFPFDGFVMICSLGLMILTFSRKKLEIRTKLLALMFGLIALTMALPYETVSFFWLENVTWTSIFLIDSLEVAVAVHLVMLIPRRPSWIEQNPWIIPITYTVFLISGIAAAAAYVAFAIFGMSDLPWPLSHAIEIQWNLGGPIWGVILILLLASAIRNAKNRTEKLQAQLVLIGLLPLILLIVGIWAAFLADVAVPETVDQLWSLFLLPFLITIAIAIFRYDLVQIEVVVERGILYTLLTTSLFIIFYAFLGIGGLAASNLFGTGQPVLVASVGALILGLLVNPLRKWLHEQIEKKLFPERNRQRQRLMKLATELPASGSVAAMAVRLVESLREILGISDATLFLVNSENGRIDWEASDPPSEEAVEVGSTFAIDEPAVRDLSEHGLLRRGAIPKDLLPMKTLMDSANAEILLPLVSNGRLIGILAIGAPTDRHHAEDEYTLNLLANNIAMVFENVRLFQSATFDGLTGLPRREIVFDRLREEIKRSERHRRPMSVAMLDLDHFKSVNDKHGHLVGDSILRTVAETFRKRLRSTDQIGRYGGEEFIVILPETEIEQALDLAEDLRRSVEAIEFHTGRGERVQTRVSIGVATLNTEKGLSSAEDLLSAADGAL
ncbi:MAG: diguanylate cyclase, partial [Thermoanaerobaculia bacterium]|nr:diguanylate cyclase [Thermoanaerobaculia bacterium]